eukprot:4772663-Alexandrium_andersonii.AAC.1
MASTTFFRRTACWRWASRLGCEHGCMTTKLHHGDAWPQHSVHERPAQWRPEPFIMQTRAA